MTIEAQVLDKNGVQCLDAATPVRFGLTGDGTLIDNLGTSTGSRSVQMYNGRALISIQTNGADSVASVSSPGLPTVFLPIHSQK